MFFFYFSITGFILSGLTFTFKFTEANTAELLKGRVYDVKETKKWDEDRGHYYVYTPRVEVFDIEENITRHITDHKIKSKNRNSYYIGRNLDVLKIPTKRGYKYLLRTSYYHYPFYLFLAGIVSLLIHFFFNK